MPNLTAGLDRAGRHRSDVEVVSYVICSVSDDPEIAWRRARIHVGTYFAHPTSDALVDAFSLTGTPTQVRDQLFRNIVSAFAR